MSQPRFWAVVPAAGIGQRFGGSVPKQYAMLDGKAVAERTLETLIDTAIFEDIVVVTAKNDLFFSKLSVSSNQKITRIDGGNSRYESVLNGLSALQRKADSNDWIVVHDIARPLISLAAINRLRVIVDDHAVGGILAAPIHDTVKQATLTVKDKPVVQLTLERQLLWAAQTPQMFRYGLLYNAMKSVAGPSESITDEASALEHQGLQVLLVSNSRQNIKITTQEDLLLARFYLANSLSDE